MKLYKLTDKNDRTKGGCQWGENITVETSGVGEICSFGWTHWYTHPLLAVFLNPIHGNFDLETAHLWEGKGKVKISDHGLKVACKKATTIKRIELPKITVEQRVRFGILCVSKVSKSKKWITWSRKWLSGEDRSWTSALAALTAAKAASAAEEAAAAALARASKAAASSEEASSAAAASASAAAASAEAAAKNIADFADFDLIEIAKQAVSEEPAG